VVAAGAGVNIPNCVSFRVQASAQGATFRIDGTGNYPIQAGEVYRFPPVVPSAGQVGRRKRWMQFRYPDIFINAGTTVPVSVIATQYDAQHEGLAENLGPGTFPMQQEGDLIPTSGTGTVLGAIGVPVLFRDVSGGNKYIIPTASNGALSANLINANLSQAVVYDTTTGAGLAQDTGVVGIFNANGTTAFDITIVFSVALTITRTLDVRLSRADATQYSLFDPIRNGASPIVLAIGRVNWLASGGLGAGSNPTGATGALDFCWGMVSPVGAGGTTGIRVNLGASGGAETTRIIISTKAGSIT
jgi:hypothetical protein